MFYDIKLTNASTIHQGIQAFKISCLSLVTVYYIVTQSLISVQTYGTGREWGGGGCKFVVSCCHELRITTKQGINVFPIIR
jgi:hypothetical protein